MKSLYLDPDAHDVVLQNFNLRFTSGDLEYRAQNLITKMKTFFGECFFNEEIGVPYIQDIFKKQESIEDVTVILKNEILKIGWVASITEFEVFYDRVTREYRMTNLVIETTEGDTIEIGEFVL